ncbi:hypothetical protein ACLOJK_004921 [Asimina triloba]
MIQIPPFTIINGHIFTVRSVAINSNVAATQTHRRRWPRWLIKTVQQVGNEAVNPNLLRLKPASFFLVFGHGRSDGCGQHISVQQRLLHPRQSNIRLQPTINE